MVFLLKLKGTSLSVAMDQYELPEVVWTEDKYGYAERGTAFVEHACRPDPVKQYRSTWLASINLNNRLNEAALERKCPKCGAAPGEGCENLLERNKGGKKTYTRHPHQERYPMRNSDG